MTRSIAFNVPRRDPISVALRKIYPPVHETTAAIENMLARLAMQEVAARQGFDPSLAADAIRRDRAERLPPSVSLAACK